MESDKGISGNILGFTWISKDQIFNLCHSNEILKIFTTSRKDDIEFQARTTHCSNKKEKAKNSRKTRGDRLKNAKFKGVFEKIYNRQKGFKLDKIYIKLMSACSEIALKFINSSTSLKYSFPEWSSHFLNTMLIPS